MITAKLRRQNNDEIYYYIGLDQLNIELLQQGRPASFDLSTIDGEGKVVIRYQKTSDDLKEDLHKLADYEVLQSNE